MTAPGPKKLTLIQGQGATTQFKQYCFHAALAINLTIYRKYPWLTVWHLDMHSGSGWNDKVNCPGSPFEYLSSIRQYGISRWRAYFCDRDQKAIEGLKRFIQNNPHCHPLCMDNREALKVFRRDIEAREKYPHLAMGTILVDPNGYPFHRPDPVALLNRKNKPPEFPMEEFGEFCQLFRRIDVILNLNVNHRCALRGCKERRMVGFANAKGLALDELPRFLNRQHWLIRAPLARGGHKFLMMVGRNYRVGDHRKLGFFHLDSHEGQAIVNAIEHPERREPVEPDGQMKLFEKG